MPNARLLPAVLLALFLPLAPVQAQSPADIITAQIDAFRESDFETAFGYASGNIRAIFGTPEVFGQMVTQGYPMVLDPAEVLFVERMDHFGIQLQRVLITDRAGVPHLLEYSLTGTGADLRINGVRILRQTGAGV